MLLGIIERICRRGVFSALSITQCRRGTGADVGAEKRTGTLRLQSLSRPGKICYYAPSPFPASSIHAILFGRSKSRVYDSNSNRGCDFRGRVSRERRPCRRPARVACSSRPFDSCPGDLLTRVWHRHLQLARGAGWKHLGVGLISSEGYRFSFIPSRGVPFSSDAVRTN